MEIHKDQGILSVVTFGGRLIDVTFKVVHNLPAFGLDMQDDIDAFVNRPKMLIRGGVTPQVFCNFVLKRHKKLAGEIFCVPQKMFLRVCKAANFEPEIQSIIVQEDQAN